MIQTINSDASVQIAYDNQCGYVSNIVCTDVLPWLLVQICAIVISHVHVYIQNGATPVYIAAQQGHVGALKALISAGANINTAKMVSIECVNFFIHYCLYYTTFGIQTWGKYRNRPIIVNCLY